MEDAAKRFVTEAVAKLLSKSHFTQPAVNPLLIGARHDIYFMVRSLPEVAAGYKSLQHGESWVVTLEGDASPECQTVAAARAVAEVLIGVPEEYLEVKDKVLERAAAELLMPEAWFDESLKSFGYDVAALKRRFGVTYEAAAMRTLDFRPAVLTVYDNLEVVTRVVVNGLDCRSDGSVGPEPSLAEKEIAQRAIESGTYQRASDSTGLIECQPIPREPGVQRVFCFKVPK